ncbi:hypothetical protein HDU80_008201 [Chytriomyces hyalinus]|nr:hypothetical protein HDU80_008201 [Chytriomyces hyalinus]
MFASGSTLKDATKDKTTKVTKGKAGKTGKLCSTCRKGNHALKDCPKVKEVFKGMAKQASSDGDTAMDTTNSDETLAPTGASKWTSASSKAFQKLTLVPGGCGHLADLNKTIPIEESLGSIAGLLEGTDDNISFGTENIFYTLKATGFKYMIGKRCDTLTSSGSVSTAIIPLDEEVDVNMERVNK